MRAINLLFVIAGLGCSMAGCAHEGRTPECPMEKSEPHQFPGVISPAALPKDWRLTPDVDMPASEKAPSWRNNPQVFCGSAVLEYTEGEPTQATQIWTARYVNEDTSPVLVSCFLYASPADAAAELSLRKKLAQADLAKDRLVGLRRDRTDEIVEISMPPYCPNSDFWIKYFGEIAVPSPSDK